LLKKNDKKRTLESRLAQPVFALLLAVVLGYLFGFSHGYAVRGGLWSSALRKGEVNLTQIEEFQLFWSVADIINRRYYGDFNLRDLVYGSVQGLVFALNDPYTSFELPTAGKKFLQELSGNYEGVGIEVEQMGDEFVVVAPLKGSPAEAAGVKAGDTVLAIDGESVWNLSLVEVISKIRGPKGSKVKLTVKRGDQTLQFEITRTVLHIQSVSVREDGDFSIITVSKFGDDTETLFKRVVESLLKEGKEKIILDLRNNPGGLLEAAVRMANEFLPAGKTIVEERFRDGRRSSFTSDGTGRLTDVRIVVLINGGTASAAEIVAGALKDNSRAQLLGERTFGKGSVQEVDEFADGSILKLTIAAWFTPKGYSLSAGIKPDVEVKEEEGEDIVLTKARALFK